MKPAQPELEPAEEFISMRRHLTGVYPAMFAFLLAAATTTAVAAREFKAGSIVITNPWTRMPPAAAKVAGGYMTITNTGTTSDRLLGGTVGIAARLEVHEMTLTDGVMRMRELDRGIEIKPGATMVLKPGSYHIMFMDLTAAPAPNQTLLGTLVFEKAGTVAIEYKVEPAGRTTSGGHTDDATAGAAKAHRGSGSGSGAGTHAK